MDVGALCQVLQILKQFAKCWELLFWHCWYCGCDSEWLLWHVFGIERSTDIDSGQRIQSHKTSNKLTWSAGSFFPGAPFWDNNQLGGKYLGCHCEPLLKSWMVRHRRKLRAEAKLLKAANLPEQRWQIKQLLCHWLWSEICFIANPSVSYVICFLIAW